MGFCWVNCQVSLYHAGSAVVLMAMVIFFLDCTFPPLVEIREHPEFHGLMEMDKSHCPRCLLSHGWLPLLSGANGGSPWAEDPAESAAHQLECALGSYTPGCRLSLMLRVLLDVCLTSLMSGQMEAWFMIRSQELVFQVLGFSLIFLVVFGLKGGGSSG